MAVLGAIMLEPTDAYQIAADHLSRRSFYLDGHGIMFEVMGELHRRGTPPDCQSVLDELRSRDLLTRVGGSGVVMGMLNAVPTAANIEHHARKVADKAQQRLIQATAYKILDKVDEGTMETTELIARTVTTLQKIDRQGGRAGKPVAAEVLAKEYRARFAQRCQEVDDLKAQGIDPDTILTGLPTGLIDVDRATDGMRHSELGIIASRPSQGKSALMLNIADAQARQGIHVGFISLEMTLDMLMPRLASMETHRLIGPDFVDTISCVNPAHLGDYYRRMVDRAYYDIECRRTAALHLVEDCPRDFGAVSKTARRLVQEDGCQSIFIDYLQLMVAEGNAQNRNYELSAITGGLKELARILRVPVWIGSQLNRQVDKDGKVRRPRLSDLRDSGAIEQDADTVMFIWPEQTGGDWVRPETKGQEFDGRSAAAGERSDSRGHDPAAPIDGKLIIAKGRNGPVGDIKIRFLPECTRFLSAAWRAA